MADATEILNAIDAGDPHAAEQLLPLVYDELRELAAAKLAHEQPGQPLDATALVHEAYVRLVGARSASKGADFEFANRRHFFAAAAEAMRRILIDRARERQSLKRGGDRQRVELDKIDISADHTPEHFLALDEALAKLEKKDPRKAALVKLRFFAGLTNAEAAAALGVSTSTADNDWAYARAWLRLEIEKS